MITAEQIATALEMELYTVRYRLASLRRSGKVKATHYGNTYVYSDKAKKLVEAFGEEKGTS